MTFEMKGKIKLIVFIGLITLALIDLGLVLFASTEMSISAAMTKLGVKAPFFTFMLGMLAGHFWPMSLKTESVCPKCGADVAK